MPQNDCSLRDRTEIKTAGEMVDFNSLSSRPLVKFAPFWVNSQLACMKVADLTSEKQHLSIDSTLWLASQPPR